MEIDGKRLRARRNALGWTQTKLGEVSGLGQSTVSKLERGELDGRPRDTQDALALALGTTAEYLCGLVDDPGPVPAEPRVERDPEPHVQIDDAQSPLEAALAQAFDPKRHQLRDVDNVRSALRRIDRMAKEHADWIDAARTWLDAAAQLRREGDAVTLDALLIRITVGKGAVARHRAERVEEEMNERADAEARAAGVEPGSARDLLATIIANDAKGRSAKPGGGSGG